jgi:hypothetical protein
MGKLVPAAASATAGQWSRELSINVVPEPCATGFGFKLAAGKPNGAILTIPVALQAPK